MTYKLYWGDTHLNIRQGHLAQWHDSFEAARDHLDFLAVAYYPMDVYTRVPGLGVESWHNRPQYLHGWKRINQLCREFNEPGRFVTYPGYEWHGDRKHWGDHNVFYPTEGYPLDDTDAIETLYAHLRARGGIAIPHHLAYLVGERGKDWDHFDPAISPFAELYSNHGSSEQVINPFLQRNAHMGPWTSGGSYVDGLAQGLRVGAIASGDSHHGFGGVHGSGLMGVWAEELSRASLWEAFLARRVYGITGDRIGIEYTANDGEMGSEVTSRDAVTAKLRISCPQALDRVEWLRNGRVLRTYCHLDGREPPRSRAVRCRFRVEPGWGLTPSYGFEHTEKEWQGRVSVDSGALSIVQGCWTDFGNRLHQVDDRNVGFETLTRSVERGRSALLPQNFCALPTQPFILEYEGDRSARVRIDAAPFDVTFDIDTALARTQLWADIAGAQRAFGETYGLEPHEIENHDVYYHNAYKLRVLQAVPTDAFEVEIEMVDPDPPAGTNAYYARVSQVNGQMAWTSPIWVTNES